MLIALVLFTVMTATADTYPDDHADTLGGATVVSPGTPANAAIEIDIDEDWFAFTARPLVEYEITVSTGTIWDTTVELWTPDGAVEIAETGTAWTGSSSPVRWTNTGVAATYYLKVSGFVEFTTGTYTLAISPTNSLDSDGDGMLDSWEQDNFGTLTNNYANDTDGDGIGDGDEYLMLTQPTNAASGLFITSIDEGTNEVAVAWPASQYASYQIEHAEPLTNGTVWSVLDETMHTDLSLTEIYADTRPQTNSATFYRVKFLY